MARNILFTAAVILIVLSLFLPWFTINQSQDRSVKDGFYEDGVNVKTESSVSVKSNALISSALIVLLDRNKINKILNITFMILFKKNLLIHYFDKI